MTETILPDPAEQPETDASLVRQLLANRDIECPRCGYSLRAIVTGRCPECGLALTLKSFHTRRHKPLPGHLRVAMVLFVLATGAFLLVIVDSEFYSAIPCCILPLLVPVGLWYGAWYVGSKASGEHEQWKLGVLGGVLWGIVAAEVLVIVWAMLFKV